MKAGIHHALYQQFRLLAVYYCGGYFLVRPTAPLDHFTIVQTTQPAYVQYVLMFQPVCILLQVFFNLLLFFFLIFPPSFALSFPLGILFSFRQWTAVQQH